MRTIPMLVVLFFVFSCTENKKRIDKVNSNQLQKKEAIIEKNSSEDFDSFFKKFSTDSKFRMSRVEFPLKGFNSDETNVDSKDKTYLWSKEDWLFYAEEDFINKSEDAIKTDITKTDTSVIYRIYKENSGYDIQYEFQKNNKQWFLVYYSYKNF